MSDGGPQPVRHEKRSGPIVQTGRVRRAGGRRQALIAVFVVIVIGGLIAGGYFLFMPRDTDVTISDFTVATVAVETLLDTVEVSGTVAARSTATVTTPETGFLDALFVDEGDWVTAGATIARIDAQALQDELQTLERSLDKNRRERDRFVLQHEYDLRGYERERQNLQKTIDDAEADLTETRELFDLGSATRTEVDNARDALSDARDALSDHEAEVEEANALYELSLANYDDDIEASSLEIEDLQERLADTTVTAPIAGRVVSIADAATVSGELLQQYATILQLADTRDPVIESEIEEQYVPLIDVGQPVSVEVSGVSYEGAIERIGQTAAASSDGGTPTVEIDITIDADSGEILPGSSALVEVLVGQIDDALVLPRGPYLTSGNRKYLFRVTGDEAERIEVEYGIVTDERVRILSGVEAGDRIITSSYQSYVDRTSVHLDRTTVHLDRTSVQPGGDT